MLARVFEGTLAQGGQKIRLWSNGRVFQVEALGVLTPKPVEINELVAGEVGFIIANIKNVADTKIGDTITDDDRPALEPLPGFEEIKPMVFAGLYTVDAHEHTQLREALEKLKLNDSSFFFEPESSAALGFGFRCGFLGLLAHGNHPGAPGARIQSRPDHDRPRRALPGFTKTDGEVIEVDNPSRWPDASEIAKVEEPVILAVILTNEEYVGGILKLVEEKRGKQKSFEYVSASRVMLQYELPLNEIVLDFYDRLKSVSRGYASLDYHLSGTWESPMAKLDIMVAGEPVDALSTIIHRDFAYERGRALATKMKELIPRQMFEVAIQAAIGAKIIARETVPAIRKNVLAKCYGGDITRKRKLLEKQKEGKKRMKRIGRVDIPQEAFLAVLKVGEGSS